MIGLDSETLASALINGASYGVPVALGLKTSYYLINKAEDYISNHMQPQFN